MKGESTRMRERDEDGLDNKSQRKVLEESKAMEV